jgi:hypothetical protein
MDEYRNNGRSKGTEAEEKKFEINIYNTTLIHIS